MGMYLNSNLIALIISTNKEVWLSYWLIKLIYGHMKEVTEKKNIWESNNGAYHSDVHIKVNY